MGLTGSSGRRGSSVAHMFEFDSERVSSFDATSLSAKLTHRSSDGWDVVAIVPAGSDIVAYLRRATGGTASTAATAGTATAGTSAGATGGDGWASASGSSGQQATPASSAPAGASAATAAAAAPADWYADPSGRHEQRYWDGSAWTHHVADRGQVSSDPPVD